MSDQNEQTGGASELDVLKQRARLMGITFSNNIGLDALRARVNAKIEGETVDNEAEEAGETKTSDEVNGLEAAAEVAEKNDFTPAPGTKPQVDVDADGHDDDNGQFVDGNKAAAAKPVEKKAEKPLTPQAAKAKLRSDMIKEQMKLVRCRIQNLDPKKKDLPGEIFTVANRILGTVRKYVPYGEVTDDGYHIPYIIYQELESRRFLNIRTTKDRRTGAPKVSQSYAKEFAIEVLPPLTKEELNRLATAQAAAGSVDSLDAA